MRPFIIGIGGAHSGAGKTSIASLILKRLKGWGAIKYTKTSLYCSITDDREILSEEGKDTKRLLDAGAERVLWVQSPAPELEEILPIAAGRLADLKGILVEGNSAIEFLKPDVVIFISGTEGRFKKSAEKILSMADVVIFEKDPPPRTPEAAKKFRSDDMEGFLNFIKGLLPL
ncbi:MAG: molybdopterin-guanine dinucleotide biosynthesis protein B [Nitrospira sp.]|nr:molybdopterin-guanine dinucleotide biosynthesis protein B [Nitrospira sp.]